MSEQIGQQLRQKREQRALTIEQAAAATRIRAHYLRAIESSDWDALPSAVHVRGFLRAYAEYLELDSEPLIAELEGTEPSPPVPQPPQPPPNTQPQLNDTARQIQEEAGEIFKDIGRKLLGQRELLGLSLEDVERHTHIRQHYLRALEAGNLEGLPSPVQGRGMLNNYASFLGLNSEALLLRFADGLQAQLQARRSADPQTSKPVPIREKTTPPSRLRKLLSPDILIGGSLVIFLGVFIVWGVIRIFAMTSETDPLPTAPSIAEILLATASPSQTSIPLPETPTPPSQAGLFPTQPVFPTGTLEEGAEPPASGGAAVQVYLTILQRAWMRVTVDGKIEFQGRVLAGSAYPFVGSSQVEVLTSNGAAVQVFFNGTDVGTMGDPNEIVDLVFIPQGAFPPTPTVTPTPAPTQPIIPTVPPAATLAPPPNP